MKKLLFVLLCLFVGQASWAQEMASMRGIWYNPATAELLGIEADDNGLISGTGVYYGKGNQRLKQMQIMQQKPLEDNKYFVKIYDMANPNMAYELTSMMTPGGIQIALTRTGSRDKNEYFYQLTNVEFLCKASYFKEETVIGALKFTLSELKFNSESGSALQYNFRASSPTTQDSEVKIGDRTIQVTMNPNTHNVSFSLPPHGKVTAKLESMMGWAVVLYNASGAEVKRFEQIFE